MPQWPFEEAILRSLSLSPKVDASAQFPVAVLPVQLLEDFAIKQCYACAAGTSTQVLSLWIAAIHRSITELESFTCKYDSNLSILTIVLPAQLLPGVLPLGLLPKPRLTNVGSCNVGLSLCQVLSRNSMLLVRIAVQ